LIGTSWKAWLSARVKEVEQLGARRLVPNGAAKTGQARRLVRVPGGQECPDKPRTDTDVSPDSASRSAWAASIGGVIAARNSWFLVAKS
jgi:hypothetical protein